LGFSSTIVTFEFPSTHYYTVKIDGIKLGTLTIPNTNGWQTYKTLEATMNLSAGTHRLRLEFPGADFNLNWVKFSPLDSSNPTPYPTNVPTNKPTTVSFLTMKSAQFGCFSLPIPMSQLIYKFVLIHSQPETNKCPHHSPANQQTHHSSANFKSHSPADQDAHIYKETNYSELDYVLEMLNLDVFFCLFLCHN